MIKLMDLLAENSTSTYKYGCVMLYFNFPQIDEIHDYIDIDDIYVEDEDKTFGLEDEPHTTLLYGLHPEVSLDEVKKVLDSYDYYPCIIKNASLFENEKYDVLKFDVDGKDLKQTNNDLKQYPFTNDYPDYHPHLTIGYIKPGLGKKYTKILKGLEFKLLPQYAIYSHSDGNKDKIKIKTYDK
jgi:2'-5' RNA ligase